MKIVPCGLTYLNAHKFRSMAVVQYGDPFECPERLVEMYKRGNGEDKAACGEVRRASSEATKHEYPGGLDVSVVFANTPLPLP